jgi:hypothetical protein
MEEALYKGNSHDNGGIKVLVDGLKPIEVEGHEYLLCNKAMQSTKIFEFKNKTNKEILDEFHTYSTCEFKQNEAHSGDFIICKKVVLDTNKRNITGTIKEIVNIMQSEKGCRQSNDDVFKTGGEVENDKTFTLITYYVTAETDRDSSNIYNGTDYERAKLEFDSANNSDFDGANGGMVLFQKVINKYKFIGDLEDGYYELSDFPIEDYYNDKDYYKIIENGEFEHIDSKDVADINNESDDLLHDVESYYQKTYGNWKYNKITVDNGKDENDDDYKEYGCIQLRITNHSENVNNNDKFGRCDYYISIVIANKNPTKEKFLTSMYERRRNEIELTFNSDNSFDEIINEINSEIGNGKLYIAEKLDLSVDDVFKTGGDVGENAAIKEILEKAKPFQNELTQIWVKKINEEGKITLSDWDIEMYQFGLIVDLAKAVGNYIEKHDTIEDLKFQKSQGAIIISCKIIRNGKEHDFSTEVIVAGGYNVQKMHFRYIVSTKLAHQNSNAEYEKLNEQYKKMSKAQKLKEQISASENTIAKYQSNLNKAKENSELSDLEVEKLARLEDNRKDSWRLADMTWNDLPITAKGNYKNDKFYFEQKQKEYKQSLINFWRTVSANYKRYENNIIAENKQIAKLNKKLSELGISKMKTGGEIDKKEVENQGSLNLMKWYIDWYKNISDKMNITLSLPNLLAPFIEKNVVIMDLFEKINQDIDAKTYLHEIIKKADEYKVTIYLEPMPRYKYFLKNIEKRKKISKEYLIAYYEKFGFKLTPNAQFMKRKFNSNEINIFDETKYDDNGKVCYWKTYTFNDSSISIDYCLDNFFKIDAIGTKEKSRRVGDASKLIAYVKEIAVKNNFQKIDVYLPIDENTPRKEYSLKDYKKAVSFYKKNGFKFYKNSTVKMFTELKTKENENTNGKTEIDTNSNKLLIEKAILYISEGIRTAEKEPREYKKNELIDLEAKLCYNFAVANKLWIINTDILGLPLSGGGNENELYYEEKTGIISKVNNLLNHGASVLNFLKYIQYHNLLFEANSYNLIGFTGFDNEANNIKNAIPYVIPIISQIYVTESVKASINEIKKYMQIIGFEKVDEFTYKNSEYIVSDLRPRNVLKDSEGNIHVIDNIIKINEMKTGGEINLKKLVEPVNDLAIEINNLYNQWHKVKNDKDYKEWQEDVKSKKYGTYKNKDILDILDNFEPKYPNDIIKRDWIIELHKALGQDIPTHLRANVKVSDYEINKLQERISEKNYKYALLLRPFDIGTYPKENFIKFIDDEKYPHGLIEYSKPIPLEKIKHYSLSPITEINEFDGKEFTYYEDLKAKAQIVKNNSNIPYVKVTMFDENNEVSDEATIDAVNFMENVSSGRYKIISEKETLKGGAGDKKTIENIAKKHNVSLDYAEQQLAKGIKIESEHTNDIEKQTEIAIDHLFEFIEYYNELEKMETNLKAKEKPMKNTDIEINSEIVNNYDQVPVVWKNTNEVKEINFIANPFNKDLIKILTPFAGTDELRPIFSGIHCDKNGITVTDAHKLITLPYPNKDFKGTYATFPNTKIISASGAEVKNDIFTNIDYPNYAVVIPKAEDAERVQKISVYKLLQYTEVALHYSNKATNQVIYNLGNLGIGANGKFLIDILETALKLGYKELYAYTTTKSRPIVFSPSKNYTLGKDVILLCMPTYIVEEFGDEGTKVYYYGAADLDFAREITAYYDFSKDEIVNKDGSIADFKMNYGEYDVLSSNEIKMLKNFAKNTSLPILEYFRVKDNEISASDLETYLTIKETNLKDGLYKINDNAAEYDSSMTLGNFDMFPNPNEDKSENQIKFIINSEVLLHYINIAIDYTGKDELRPVMTGILFDYKDDKMFMVATDAHKLFKLEITQYVEINKGQKDFQFILSKANLLKFLENTDESSVIVSATINNVTFENDLFKFKSRLIDGRYPNYNAVIPTYKTKKLIINIKDLFSCLKSKEAENFIKANKKEEIRIYNKIGKSNDVFDIFLCYTEYDRAKETHNIVSEIKICQVNYKLEDGNFQIQNNLVLLMPVNLALADNFTFDLKYFKVILESLNCENVEMLYDEKNRAYIFGGDCFAYKHTIKAQKSISKPKETPAKTETKKVETKTSKEKSKGIEAKFKVGDNVLITYGEEVGKSGIVTKVYSHEIYPKSIKIDDTPNYEIKGASKNIPQDNLELKVSSEFNEIEKAIETFEMLIGLGGTKKELKEWNEAVETFKMLVGDDKKPNSESMKVSFEDWLKENNIDVYKRTYYWVADDGKGDYRYSGTKAQVMKALKDEWKNKFAIGGNLENSFYALTSDGMKNKKKVKILNVQYWKGRETNHAPTLENIKEFLAQVPFDEKIVIYADEDYIDDSTSFYGQLHSAYTPLYTAGAIQVDAIVDENNNIIWNLYSKGKYVINVNDYKFKHGGDVKTNESDWFWNHAYRHYIRDASLEQRNEVKEQFIKEGLELDGESPRHFEIISNIIGEYADGGDINDLTY